LNIIVQLIAVVLKNSAGSGDKVDMENLFGCIGIYSFLGFWWLGMDFFFENFTQQGLQISLM